MGSSGCSPLARKRFYELDNLTCGSGHWGLVAREELELPLDITRRQCHPTAQAPGGVHWPQMSQTGLAQVSDLQDLGFWGDTLHRPCKDRN